MKGLKKILLIPILMVMIAGLTYFTLDSFFSSTKEDAVKPKSELKQQEENNKNIAGIIKTEEAKINRRLQETDILKLNKGAKLILKKVNPKSGEQQISEKEVSDLLVGLTEQEVESKLKRGNIINFDSNKIVVEVKENKNTQLEEDLKNSKTDEKMKKKEGENEVEEKDIKESLYLGIKDGYVAIYKGDSLGAKELQEIRKDIPVSSLPQEDKKALMKGIEVNNQEELLSVLEGFISAINE